MVHKFQYKLIKFHYLYAEPYINVPYFIRISTGQTQFKDCRFTTFKKIENGTFLTCIQIIYSKYHFNSFSHL